MSDIFRASDELTNAMTERIKAILEAERPTNGDRIREMTDEELADLLWSVEDYYTDEHGNFDPRTIVMGHAFRDSTGVLEWLKSPVKGEEE